MKINYLKERFEEMVNVEKPNPNEVGTTSIIKSNRFVSLVKKGDNTFAFRDETIGNEDGRCRG